jgi:hypothetical protein
MPSALADLLSLLLPVSCAARAACCLQLSIREGELNLGVSTQAKQFDINRKIQIVYLDDTLRIAR